LDLIYQYIDLKKYIDNPILLNERTDTNVEFTNTNFEHSIHFEDALIALSAIIIESKINGKADLTKAYGTKILEFKSTNEEIKPIFRALQNIHAYPENYILFEMCLEKERQETLDNIEEMIKEFEKVLDEKTINKPFNTYSEKYFDDLYWLRGMRKRPLMIIKTTDTQGFITLIYKLLNEVELESNNEFHFYMEVIEKNKFTIKMKNANFDDLLRLIVPNMENLWWKSGRFDICYFIAYTESSFTKIIRKNKIYLFESSGTNYKTQTIDTDNDEQSITIDFKLDTTIFEDLNLDFELMRTELDKFSKKNPHMKMSFENKIQSK